MKKNILSAICVFAVALMGLVSCEDSSTSAEFISNNSALDSYCEVYTRFSLDHGNMATRTIGIGEPPYLTRIASCSDAELNDIISQIPSDSIKKWTKIQKTAMDTFFENFTAEDYAWLRSSTQMYLQSGGHNKVTLQNIAQSTNSNLNICLGAVCALADLMAPMEFWRDNQITLDDGRVIVSQSTPESICVEKLRTDMILTATENGITDCLALLGLEIPGVEELELIAFMYGMVYEYFDYRLCLERAHT